MMELVASISNLQYITEAIKAYEKAIKPIEKSAEEIKYEQIAIKSMPETCGTHINLLI